MAPAFQIALRITLCLLAVYLGLLGLLYFAQGRLIYMAERASEEVLTREARTLMLEPWRDGSGDLIGWRRPNPGAANRIVVFHGSAGWALLRDHFVEALQRLDGGRTWEVMLFEYPGYGARAGTPSERAIVAAAKQHWRSCWPMIPDRFSSWENPSEVVPPARWPRSLAAESQG